MTGGAMDRARELDVQEGRPPRRARVCNLLRFEAMWALSEALPRKAKVNGGRPSDYPLWVFVAFDALIAEFGSAVEVARELADPDIWQLFEEAARIRYPNNPEMWPGPTAPRRHHFQHAKRSVLTSPEALEAMGREFRFQAAALAKEIGLCDLNGKGSWTHPDLTRAIYGDGTVVTPRYKARQGVTRVDPGTGEVLGVRADPDAEDFVTGGGQQAFGLNFIFWCVRGSRRNERVILDVHPAPRAGGEALHALDSLRRVAPLLPGAQAVLYDGAMKGTHLREIYGLGLIPIANIGKATGGGTKQSHLGSVEGLLPSGAKVNVDVHLFDGSPHLKTLRADASPMLIKLERRHLKRRGDKAGFRFYQDYAVPVGVPATGGATLTLRLNSRPEDRRQKLNREEHLRAVPPADPDYPRLYGRRNDAESGNRILDDSMLRGRSHSVGRAGTHLNLLTFALFKNAQTRGLYARTESPPGSGSGDAAAA